MKLEGTIFYIRIESEEVRRSILEFAPIFIFGRIFVIQQWSTDLENQREKIDKVPVWVKL